MSGLDTSDIDPTGSLSSLGTLHQSDYTGSMTSLDDTLQNDDGLGTRNDDLMGSITSLDSVLDTRPRLSPIQSIMEDTEGDEPHITVQASEWVWSV